MGKALIESVNDTDSSQELEAPEFEASELNRVLIECVNIGEVEARIFRFKARIREINDVLQSETDPTRIAVLEGEWVESHLQILNFRSLIGMKLDAVLEQMYLGKSKSNG